jgi:16S rRNA (cytosine1402-N4)-methyltransferase
MSAYHHYPVLLKEVLEYLSPKPGQNFVDATLGGGGYSKEILEKIHPDGKLLSIDLDTEAIENFKYQISNVKKNQKSENLNPESVIIHHGNFKDIDKIVKHYEFSNISGIVADIGFSSFQLDQSGRGIAFSKNEPLDMRFDQSQETDAKFILETYTELQLKQIFEEYGEEKFSRQIARKIVESRQQSADSNKRKAIHYTTDLYQIIQEALPKPVKHKAEDSARRIFQALRIEVNKELSNLEEFLPKAFALLNPGGRLAVVSFHSLEDRIVKQYFVGLSKGCVCPPEFPQCLCGKNPQGKILTKKIVTASQTELAENSRSKPAKLRVIEKL